MKIIGLFLAIIVSLLSVIAFIPLLGWLYWVIIPIGIIALLFSVIGNSGLGKTLSVMIIAIGICRLMIGGGII